MKLKYFQYETKVSKIYMIEYITFSVKEEYRKRSYYSNEMNIKELLDIDGLVTEIYELFHEELNNNVVYFACYKRTFILHSPCAELFLHGSMTQYTEIISKLIPLGFKLKKEYLNKFKKSKAYKLLSTEIKLQMELE